VHWSDQGIEQVSDRSATTSKGSDQREMLRATVAQTLRDSIASGGFPPGTRLSERRLCASLGVSRSALREAVRQLEADELLETTPQKGTFVASPNLEDALDLYEVRIELEGLAARLAARLRDAQGLARLEASLAAIAKVTATGSVEEIAAAKSVYYEQLVDVSGNAVLKRSLERLRTRILLYRGVALNEKGRATAALLELREIQAAIAESDASHAERMSRVHISKAARSLANALAKKEGREMSATERLRLDLLDATTETRAVLFPQSKGSTK
jgi:DNA-binding GntR family transcriptional regulator